MRHRNNESCSQCRHRMRPENPGFVVRVGRDRKSTTSYFGPYGLACSLECAALKDPVEWSIESRRQQAAV